MTLLKVIALTRALGEQRSEPEVQPEIFRWSDTGGSYVTCTFANGRLVAWELERPEVQASPVTEPPGPPGLAPSGHRDVQE